MDNPEALVTQGTQDTGRRQKQKQKTKKMSHADPPKNRGQPGFLEG